MSGEVLIPMENMQEAQTSLQKQNERLQLLLNLTNQITSNLELREVLRSIAGNIRKLMQCDGAGISVPGKIPGTFRLLVLDFPEGKGFLKEEQLISRAEHAPAKRAFETLTPVIVSTEDPDGLSPPPTRLPLPRA